MRRFAVTFGFALLIGLGAWPAQSPAEDAPPPPPVQGPPLERLFAPVKEQMAPLPPFLRDMDLRVHFRTYYFNRNQPSDVKNEALAFGGWISLQSGWLLDTFAMGATLYGSAPLYAPDDRDGTLLLKPGQEGYYVPGEAWGALRYKDYALLKGYRQQVDQTYINPQDNRMTPNTFEALTLGGKVGWLQYLAGYLWNIKTRNSDEFVAMSAAAGVKGQHDGVGLAGVRLTPMENLRLDVSNQYGVNMFKYRELTLTGAFTVNGNGNAMQNPWGTSPGYLTMIDQDFDRANEKGWLIGAAYDFSKVLTPGLSANFNIAWGRDAINPSTRQKAPDQTEYDFTADYRFPRSAPAFLQGVWFRARSAILDQAHSRALGYQFRLIINWERDLI